MLYTSTRGDKDAFTAPRTLLSDISPDGGLFVPFRLPVFSQEEIRAFGQLSFGESVAKILNTFFSCRLTGWDVDFAVGREPVKLFQMNHRLIVSELWHNAGGDYSYLVQKLYDRIRLPDSRENPTEWARIAIRIAVLFGIFSCMLRDRYDASGKTVDLAVSADDFALPMAAWYCKRMGLPIGMIACGCSNDSSLWDLLNHGEYSASAVAPELWMPYERLLRETLGTHASVEYSRRCSDGKTFAIPEPALTHLSSGMFAAVVGTGRVNSLISTVFRSSGYRLSKECAIAYGALQDYRTGNNVSRNSLILADTNPAI